MDALSKMESAFVAAGGMLWCMTESPDKRWELFAIYNGKKRHFAKRFGLIARAEDWIYSLALISSLACDVNVHHCVCRRTEAEAQLFPIMTC